MVALNLDVIAIRYITETGGVDMSKNYILVVDDDPDLVETVAMMLESKDCEVGKAYDGVEGEESIRKRRPDLLILDVMMPRKDGYQLCSELKADESTRSIPIVLLTAVGEAIPSTSYTHADGMATEADEYIAKPIDTESMWNIVSSLL
jgi:CheY-like chemotaxis protein